MEWGDRKNIYTPSGFWWGQRGWQRALDFSVWAEHFDLNGLQRHLLAKLTEQMGRRLESESELSVWGHTEWWLQFMAALSRDEQLFLRDKGCLWGVEGVAAGQRAVYLSAAPSEHLRHLDHRAKGRDRWTLQKCMGARSVGLVNQCSRQVGFSKDKGSHRIQTATVYYTDTAFLMLARKTSKEKECGCTGLWDIKGCNEFWCLYFVSQPGLRLN